MHGHSSILGGRGCIDYSRDHKIGQIGSYNYTRISGIRPDEYIDVDFALVLVKLISRHLSQFPSNIFKSYDYVWVTFGSLVYTSYVVDFSSSSCSNAVDVWSAPKGGGGGGKKQVSTA